MTRICAGFYLVWWTAYAGHNTSHEYSRQRSIDLFRALHFPFRTIVDRLQRYRLSATRAMNLVGTAGDIEVNVASAEAAAYESDVSRRGPDPHTSASNLALVRNEIGIGFKCYARSGFISPI
jgi:hypothetical protein